MTHFVAARRSVSPSLLLSASQPLVAAAQTRYHLLPFVVILRVICLSIRFTPGVMRGARASLTRISTKTTTIMEKQREKRKLCVCAPSVGAKHFEHLYNARRLPSLSPACSFIHSFIRPRPFGALLFGRSGERVGNKRGTFCAVPISNYSQLTNEIDINHYNC